MPTFAADVRKPRPRPSLERLEYRCLPSASPYYSVDGTGNNPDHPDWGAVGQDLLRTAPARYADGVSAPGGADRPSARLINDVLATDATDGNLPNDCFLSD